MPTLEEELLGIIQANPPQTVDPLVPGVPDAVTLEQTKDDPVPLTTDELLITGATDPDPVRVDAPTQPADPGNLTGLAGTAAGVPEPSTGQFLTEDTLAPQPAPVDVPRDAVEAELAPSVQQDAQIDFQNRVAELQQQFEGLSPDEAARLAQSENRQRALRIAQNQAEAQQTADEGTLEAEKQFNEERQRIVQERQQAFQEGMEQLQASFQELQNTKIEPGRLWNRMSTGRKVGSMIGVMLSGLATPAGGRNSALEILNRFIDQDIDAQKANLANQRANFGQQQSMFQLGMERFGDAELAADLAKVAALQSVRQQVQDVLNRGAPDRLAERAAAINNAADQAILEQQEAARQRMIEAQQRNLKNELDIADARRKDMLARADAGLKRAQAAKARRAGRAQVSFTPAEDINLAGTGITVNGQGLLKLGDKQLRKDVASTINSEVEAVQILDRIVQSGEIGRQRLGARERELLVQDLRTLIESKILSEGRGLSNEDAAMMMEAIGDTDPNRFFRLVGSDTIKEKLKRRRDRTISRIQRRVTDVSAPGTQVVVNPPPEFAPAPAKGKPVPAQRSMTKLFKAQTPKAVLDQLGALDVALSDDFERDGTTRGVANVTAAIQTVTKDPAKFVDVVREKAKKVGADPRQLAEIEDWAESLTQKIDVKNVEQARKDKRQAEFDAAVPTTFGF